MGGHREKTESRRRRVRKKGLRQRAKAGIAVRGKRRVRRKPTHCGTLLETLGKMVDDLNNCHCDCASCQHAYELLVPLFERWSSPIQRVSR